MYVDESDDCEIEIVAEVPRTSIRNEPRGLVVGLVFRPECLQIPLKIHCVLACCAAKSSRRVKRPPAGGAWKFKRKGTNQVSSLSSNTVRITRSVSK
ncbi:hypothetical protein AVEN_106782-1 [Araneus ventricosus]|uniref:Uncharacterized protein n=1 Tax=Araneus ventricosus TaxID=182803 RepID=A0A4Y2F2D9_ARAVE|nr:hypothetical protein AVEN_106782-1 [Araneus ventricosus]